VNADLLVKYGVPGFVDFSVDYRSDRAIEPLQEEDALEVITQLIDSLRFGDALETSDIANVLYRYGADYVAPFQMTATVRLVDGTIQITTTNDSLQLDRNVALIPGTITVDKI
jgi:hypothetical protein